MREKHLKYFGIFVSATEFSNSTETYVHIYLHMNIFIYMRRERKKLSKISTFEDSG